MLAQMKTLTHTNCLPTTEVRDTDNHRLVLVVGGAKTDADQQFVNIAGAWAQGSRWSCLFVLKLMYTFILSGLSHAPSVVVSV